MTRPAIAVAGAGAIGRKHVALLAGGGAARLAAIVDPAPEAADLAAAHGVPHVTGLDGLGAADGVILATPTALHLPQALACIARGLPVLVEKPVTADADEAELLARAAEDAGVAVLVGHYRRHTPLIAEARRLIASGAVGRVVGVQVSVMLCKPADYFAPEWRRQPGAGPILTNLVHDIDLLRHLLGEIASVQAIRSDAVRGFAIEDTAAIALGFASGALGTLLVSDCAAAPWSWELTARENSDYPPTGEGCMWISGTEGALEIPSLRLWRHDGAPGWFTPLVARDNPVAPADPLAAQIDHFARVIRGEAQPAITIRDAARSVAVVDAIRRAAASACAQAIPERTAA